MGQMLPTDYEKKLQFFLDEINIMRPKYNILNDNLNLIINMDEIPIFYYVPFGNTIYKNWTIEVEITNSEIEKDRVPLLLAVVAEDGTKLTPLIIFKGVPCVK